MINVWGEYFDLGGGRTGGWK